MIIRIPIFALCLMMSCSASAHWFGNLHGPWQGNWLLGAQLGYTYRNGNLEVNMGHPAPNREITHLYQDIDDAGMLWGAIGGYQAFCHRVMLGIELTVNWDNVNELENFAFTDAQGLGWTGAARYERDIMYGLSLRLGFVETPYFMPYGRVGGEMSKDKLLYAGARDPLVAFPYAVVTQDERWQYNLVGAVGFETPMPCLRQLVFRMEMVFHYWTKGVDTSDFASDDVTFVFANAHARYNFATAAFVWNFR